MMQTEIFEEKRFAEIQKSVLDRFQPEIPGCFNFAYDVLDKKARETPHEKAMIHVDLQSKRRDYDYEFFSVQSSRMAHALTKMGIRKGDRVMLVLCRRMEFWVAVLALHKIGAVVIPSSFLLTAPDLIAYAKCAEVRCLMAEHGLMSYMDDVRKGSPDLEFFVDVCDEEEPQEGWQSFWKLCEGQPDVFERPTPCPGGGDPMLIFFSSGTTGMPKMVQHNFEYPLGHIATAFLWQDLRPGDIHLSVADTGWGKAMWGKFYGQWMAGAVVFVHDFRKHFSLLTLLRSVEENKVTTVCAPSTVYRMAFCEKLFNSLTLSNLRHSMTAGEVIDNETTSAWREKTGLTIYEGYGQTETTLLVATVPGMEVRPGSVGRPVGEWKVSIRDYDDQPCPPGVEGEICVDIRGERPHGLFSGYVNDPDLTAKVFRNGFYHTGDCAYMDEDGYIWFKGRMDDVIKSSGYRIGPYEVEHAVTSHEAVAEAIVRGVPDPLRGQAIKATIVLRSGYEESPELTREIRMHVKERLAPYKCPKIIEYVKELPKTVSGKLKRTKQPGADSSAR